MTAMPDETNLHGATTSDGGSHLGPSTGDDHATVSAAFLAMVDQIIDENRALLDALAKR